MTSENGVPLTRRQIREQEAARAAAAARESAPQVAPPAQASRPQQPVAQQPPARSPQPQRGQQAPAARSAQRPTQQDTDAQQRAWRQAAPGAQPPARQAAPAAPQGPSTSRVGQGRAPVEPERTSAAQSLSRRALREQVPQSRPMVVAPEQSTAIRTVDETGELSAIRAMDRRPGDTGQSAPVRGGAQAPVRDHARSAPTRPAARPPERQPVVRQPVVRQPAQQPHQPQQSQQTQWPGAGAGAAGAVQPDRAPSGLLGADQPRRPWPPVEPGGSRTPIRGVEAVQAPAEPLFEQRVSAPPVEPEPHADPEPLADADELFPTLPRWDAITSTGSDEPPTARPSTRSSVRALDEDDRLDEDDLDEDDFDDDDLDDEPDHKYTWLHYLILVAVAFVLGLIIWKVGLEGRDVASSDGSSTGGTGVALVSPDTSHHPYL
ncbi:hypothetical protein [Sanguibacter suaedae]|uniref:Uncharacterized protein n=1 Tax=Sanguibacter suaedae TaxID=2795737 RepID=A0A934I558_9MICO|nr:hypothetical protein [Sanguibacter suaedae]MBI9114436.1 hypothetical protein [Sanguibacter suaedae]